MSAACMHAILQHAPGGADTLHWGEAAQPQPGPGQLRVSINVVNHLRQNASEIDRIG